MMIAKNRNIIYALYTLNNPTLFAWFKLENKITLTVFIPGTFAVTSIPATLWSSNVTYVHKYALLGMIFNYYKNIKKK